MFPVHVSDVNRGPIPRSDVNRSSRQRREPWRDSWAGCEYLLVMGMTVLFPMRMWIALPAREGNRGVIPGPDVNTLCDGNDCSIPEADVNRSSRQRRELWHDSWAECEYLKWWELLSFTLSIGLGIVWSTCYVLCHVMCSLLCVGLFLKIIFSWFIVGIKIIFTGSPP